MRKYFLLFATIFMIVVIIAQEKLHLLKVDGSESVFNISEIDSITFQEQQTALTVYKKDFSNAIFQLNDLSEIYLSEIKDTIQITYTGATAEVINPMSGKGVEITVSGADVIIQSSLSNNELVYQVQGNSADASLKIYSDYRFVLMLNGLQLTNNDGPAINIQSSKHASIVNVSGKTNVLADAMVYTASAEDQKATFFSEGQLIFSGDGSLTVSSLAAHAICSDDFITIENGQINVTGAVKDALHCNDKLLIHGGNVQLKSLDDGIDCENGHFTMTGGILNIQLASPDVNGIDADSTLTVKGGELTVLVSGNQSKALKASQAVNLEGGEIGLTTSGGVVLTASGSGFDPSYCTAIKSDYAVHLTGANLVIHQSGAGSKGIASDANITMTGGTVQVTNTGSGATYTGVTGTTTAYNATALSADGNILLIGGSFNSVCSGAGGKGISANGSLTIGDGSSSPIVNVTTTGAGIGTTSTGGTKPGGTTGTNYSLPKALKCDGAFALKSGTVQISSTDDGIKSETSVTIEGGILNIAGSKEGIESKIINIEGGNTHVAASDDAINGTMGTAAGGTESNDGSAVNVKGGYLYAKISADSGGDAFDSNGNMYFTGGTVVAIGPNGGANEDFDVNGVFAGNGGTVMGATSSSNMNETWNTASSQYSLYLKSSTALAANTIFRIQDASGNEIVSLKNTVRSSYGFHFSSPLLKTGVSYSIYTGGSYVGGTIVDGVCSGGTYSGGTLKTAFTLSSKSSTISY